MANICCNTIKISGPPKRLRTLNGQITSFMHGRKPDPGNHSDLYDFLRSLGYSEKKLRNISCQEDFTGGPPTLKDNVLTLLTESSWNFQGSAWELVKKKYPSLEIYFLADEPGNEIFCTNDTSGAYIPQKYSLDWQDETGDCDLQYFDDDCSLIEYVHDRFDSSVGDMDAVQHTITEMNENPDGYAVIREIEYDNSFLLF